MSEELRHLKSVEEKKAIEIRNKIRFYIEHLEYRELNIAESLVSQLAQEYSTLYAKWFDENFGK